MNFCQISNFFTEYHEKIVVRNSMINAFLSTQCVLSYAYDLESQFTHLLPKKASTTPLHK